jgi:hypothetical protein
MDRFMFWKKKKSPANSAAQHLANLMGTSVAGITPVTPNDKVDLDTELFLRGNVAIASLVVITGLAKGNHDQKALILKSIEPAYLGEKSFESYLFTIVAEEIKNNGDISFKRIEQRIPEYSRIVYNEPVSKASLDGDLFKWSQIFNFEPTDEHFAKAIEELQSSAKRKGLIKDD